MNKSNLNFAVGDFIFAKIKGYRHWPGKIIEKPCLKKSNKYTVSLFGDNTVAYVKESNLLSYNDNVHIYGIPLINNGINKTFNNALREAEAAFTAWVADRNIPEPTEVSNDNCSETFFNSMDQSNINNCNYISNLHNTIENIQSKILSSDDNDLETSITLAAEAGTALLAENSKLKQELHSLTLKNSKLAQKISEKNMDNEAKYQLTIEDLEVKNSTLINRIEILTETVGQLEKQLVKERELRDELTMTFENYDKNQTDLLKKCENKINEQAKTIASLECLHKIHSNDPARELSDCETQTEFQVEPSVSNSNSPLPILSPPNSYLLSELTQLKSRQNNLELLIKNMDLQQQKYCSNTPRTTLKKHKCSTPKQLNLKKDDSKKLKNSRNYFSVSLQASKYRKECQSQQKKVHKFVPSNILQHNKTELALQNKDLKILKNQHGGERNTFMGNVPSKKKDDNKQRDIIVGDSQTNFKNLAPPSTAKIRLPEEDVEDFFNKYIDHYIKLNENCFILNPGSMPYSTNFLELPKPQGVKT